MLRSLPEMENFEPFVYAYYELNIKSRTQYFNDHVWQQSQWYLISINNVVVIRTNDL